MPQDTLTFDVVEEIARASLEDQTSEPDSVIESSSEIQSLQDVTADLASSATKSVSKSAENINQSLQDGFKLIESSIQAANNFSWWNALTITIISVILAALAAFFFNHLHWKIVATNENKNNIGKLLLSQIEQLEKFSIEYWLQGFSIDNASELDGLEIAIKSIHSSIRSNARIYLSMLKTDQRLTHERKINKFINESFETVTGGNFETHKRLASKSRATGISRLCSEIRSDVASITYS